MLGFGSGCAVLGIICILATPFPALAKAAAVMVWILWSTWELVSLWRVYRGCSGYRVYENGEIEVFDDRGGYRSGKVLPGTVVMPGWAWLRVGLTDGPTWGEALTGRTRESQQWRRFQVIFRHLNAC